MNNFMSEDQKQHSSQAVYDWNESASLVIKKCH